MIKNFQQVNMFVYCKAQHCTAEVSIYDMSSLCSMTQRERKCV